MKHIKVTSISHLRQLLERGEREFVAAFGVLRHSYWIEPESYGINVCDYSSGEDIQYTWGELENHGNYPIPRDIKNGNFYCETNED